VAAGGAALPVRAWAPAATSVRAACRTRAHHGPAATLLEHSTDVAIPKRTSATDPAGRQKCSLAFLFSRCAFAIGFYCYCQGSRIDHFLSYTQRARAPDGLVTSETVTFATHQTSLVAVR